MTSTWITKKSDKKDESEKTETPWIKKKTLEDWKEEAKELRKKLYEKENSESSESKSWITKKKKNSTGGIIEPINMATGGLMNRPIGSREENKKDEAISAYDVSTPESARQGMPSRVLGKDRTRFKHGGKMNKKGLLKRMGYNKAGPIIPLNPDDIPELEEHDDSGIVPTSEKFAGGTSARDNLINKRIDKLEAELEIADTGQQSEIINQIKKLETMKSTNIRTAALGGYMDENDIAEQTPLALSIGGAAALNEKYDRRKDYKAYAEGDIVEEDIEVEEPLMAPPGMDLAEEDAIAETDMELAAEEEVDDILDTSMLSESEEQIFEEALEMFPELEAIVPKITATEFTEDELVEGPGTGTSDSIPALLSDGEFVFTAKAVKHLGIDKLRKMMKQAEEAYDAGMVEQEDAATMASEEESLLA